MFGTTSLPRSLQSLAPLQLGFPHEVCRMSYSEGRLKIQREGAVVRGRERGHLKSGQKCRNIYRELSQALI